MEAKDARRGVGETCRRVSVGRIGVGETCWRGGVSACRYGRVRLRPNWGFPVASPYNVSPQAECGGLWGVTPQGRATGKAPAQTELRPTCAGPSIVLVIGARARARARSLIVAGQKRVALD